jgi:hypothetical protein
LCFRRHFKTSEYNQYKQIGFHKLGLRDDHLNIAQIYQAIFRRWCSHQQQKAEQSLAMAEVKYNSASPLTNNPPSGSRLGQQRCNMTVRKNDSLHGSPHSKTYYRCNLFRGRCFTGH